MAKVFVSYSRRDLPFVRDLVRDLQRRELETWFDLSSLTGGDPWPDKIERAIREASHFIVVLSPYSMESPDVAHELALAIRHQRPIVPVLLQDMRPREELRGLHWIDFRTDYEKGLESLQNILRSASPSVDPGIPAREVSYGGFVPVLFLACPNSVKAVTILIALSTFVKTARLSLLSPFGERETVIAIFTLLTGLTSLWWAYRAARRRTVWGEILAAHALMLLNPLIGLVASPPFLTFLAGTPLDLVAMLILAKSQSYRRWMVAYPSGFGARV